MVAGTSNAYIGEASKTITDNTKSGYLLIFTFRHGNAYNKSVLKIFVGF